MDLDFYVFTFINIIRNKKMVGVYLGVKEKSAPY